MAIGLRAAGAWSFGVNSFAPTIPAAQVTGDIMLDGFEPSSIEIVEAMMSLGEIGPGIKHVDLGSGDGRTVHAGRELGADSWGIEIDPVLAQQSRDTYGITVLNENCFLSDVSKADVITCWFSLQPGTTLLVEKLMGEMKRGAALIKMSYTPSSWSPIHINSNLPTEIFQGESVYRVDDNIICVYKK